MVIDKSFISVSERINVRGVGVLENMTNETLFVSFLSLVFLVELFVVVQQDFLVKQI